MVDKFSYVQIKMSIELLLLFDIEGKQCQRPWQNFDSTRKVNEILSLNQILITPRIHKIRNECQELSKQFFCWMGGGCSGMEFKSPDDQEVVSNYL